MRNHLFAVPTRVPHILKGLVPLLALLFVSWLAVPAAGASSRPAGKAAGVQRAAVAPTDPWTEGDLIQPEELARILTERQGDKPTLVYVGFPLLFKAGRIPGAVYWGTGRTAEGLAQLKKWARGLRPDQPVVMYCGCCPWHECPNVRPAFKALREAGVKRLKVLYLPTSLVRDWVEKGYPFERGS
jgi:thiosulfate/3-mercaptopyruvate sulfurtransferase